MNISFIVKHVFRLVCLLTSISVAGYAYAAKAIAVPSSIEGVRQPSEQVDYESYPLAINIRGDVLYIVYKGAGGRESQVMFARKHVEMMCAAIDKFLEWEKLATTRGETLAKKIGEVKTVSGAYVYVGFKSITKGRHVVQLGIRSRLLGDSSGTAAGITDLMIDRASAEKLKALLVRFAKGESLGDTGDVYR